VRFRGKKREGFAHFSLAKWKGHSLFFPFVGGGEKFFFVGGRGGFSPLSERKEKNSGPKYKDTKKKRENLFRRWFESTGGRGESISLNNQQRKRGPISTPPGKNHPLKRLPSPKRGGGGKGGGPQFFSYISRKDTKLGHGLTGGEEGKSLFRVEGKKKKKNPTVFSLKKETRCTAESIRRGGGRAHLMLSPHRKGGKTLGPFRLGSQEKGTLIKRRDPFKSAGEGKERSGRPGKDRKSVRTERERKELSTYQKPPPRKKGGRHRKRDPGERRDNSTFCVLSCFLRGEGGKPSSEGTTREKLCGRTPKREGDDDYLQRDCSPRSKKGRRVLSLEGGKVALDRKEEVHHLRQ